MSIAELGALGEIVSSIAVVISLVYLALQIRTNTDSVRETNATIHTDRMIRHSLLIASDNALAGIFRKGSADLGNLDPDERWKFGTYLWSLFIDFQSEFFASKRSRLDEYHWNMQHKNMLNYLRRPGIRGWWDSLYLDLDEAFVAHVNQLLKDTDEKQKDAA